jgi:DNA adenine methylase
MVKYTPFLKWVGGKTQILDNVLDKFPKKINNYYEIFTGGGSVLLGLISRIESNNIKLEGKI